MAFYKCRGKRIAIASAKCWKVKQMLPLNARGLDAGEMKCRHRRINEVIHNDILPIMFE